MLGEAAKTRRAAIPSPRRAPAVGQGASPQQALKGGIAQSLDHREDGRPALTVADGAASLGEQAERHPDPDGDGVADVDRRAETGDLYRAIEGSALQGPPAIGAPRGLSRPGDPVRCVSNDVLDGGDAIGGVLREKRASGIGNEARRIHGEGHIVGAALTHHERMQGASLPPATRMDNDLAGGIL